MSSWKLPIDSKSTEPKPELNELTLDEPTTTETPLSAPSLLIPQAKVETSVQSDGSQDKKLEIAQVEGIPANMIMMFGESPYILKTGLLWKMGQVYGKGKFSIKGEPIKGTWEGDKNVAVYKGTVEVKQDNISPVIFIDIGVATPSNVKMTTLHPHLDHLASTRATNRAMRLALAMGFCSAEELDDTKSI